MALRVLIGVWGLFLILRDLRLGVRRGHPCRKGSLNERERLVHRPENCSTCKPADWNVGGATLHFYFVNAK